MTRRANGEGSVYRDKPGSGWRGSIVLSVRGRRVRKYVRGRTRGDVLAQLQELRQQAGDGLALEAHQWTVKSWLEHWLENVIVPTGLAPTTLDLYRLALRRVTEDVIGGLTLDQLDGVAVEQWQGRLKQKPAGRLNQVAWVKFRASLERAVERRLLASNPLLKADRPGHESGETQEFSLTEARLLLRASAGTRWHVAVALGVGCGLRVSEVLGLTWSAVDLQAGTVSVVQQARQRLGRVELAPPKTKRSLRTLTAPPFVVAALHAQRKLLLAEGLAGDDFVCPAPTGGPYGRGNFTTRVWQPLIKRTEVRPLTFHSLRHTFATLALGDGAAVGNVSKTMGHSSTQITLNVYDHRLPGYSDQVAASIQSQLGDVG
jgi:integrase